MNFLLILMANIIIFSCIHFILNKVSVKLGIVDYPDHRKKHEFPVTLSGGISILVPIYFVNLFLNTDPIISLILYSSLSVLLLGIFDDMINLSAKLRLIVLIVISFIMFYFGIKLDNLGEYFIFGSLTLDYLSVFFTILSIIILINAINFTDGIDGLAISLYLQAIISLTIFIYFNNKFVVDEIIIILIFNCILFLLVNTQIIKVSKSFLGDSGSMGLGFILACLLIYFSQDPNNYLHPILVIWCIPILIFDFFGTIIIRLKLKINPLKADRLHLHHQLLINSKNKFILFKILALSIILSLLGVLSFYFFNASISLLLLLISFIAFLVLKFWLLNEKKTI